MKTHDEEHNLMMRVIFGDPDVKEDIGMKAKVDEMHQILISIKGASRGLDYFGSFLKWLLIIGAVVALVKGWFAAFLTAVAHALIK